LQTNEILQNKKAVLGPDKNGGLYLLGINKNNFQKSDFLKMSWEKSTLIIDWNSYLKNQNLDFHLLEKLADVNNAKALLQVLKRATPLQFFLKRVSQIISSHFAEVIFQIKILHTQFYIPFAQLRAPPSI